MFKKAASALTEQIEIDFPQRLFDIWTYYKGHRQLVLRAPHFTSIHEAVFPTRVDVLFKNVHALRLPTRMRGLTVSIANDELATRVARELAPRRSPSQQVFVLRGEDYEGYVIASVVAMAEDHGDDGGQSPLLPKLPRVHLSDGMQSGDSGHTGG